MTEPSATRTTLSDPSQFEKLAEEWTESFNKLLKMHTDYVHAFTTLTYTLQASLGRLQELAPRFVPLADNDPPMSAVPASQETATQPATQEVERTEGPTADIPKQNATELQNGTSSESGPAPEKPTEPTNDTDRARDRPPAQEHAAPITDIGISQQYPNYAKFRNARVKAMELLEEPPGLAPATLKRIIDAYSDAGKKIAKKIHDEKACRDTLCRHAGELLNELQELDMLLDPSQPRSADTLRLSELRDLLWQFIQAATNNEYKLVLVQPPENIEIGEWAKNNNFWPEGTYFKNTSVNSIQKKDYVVRTLRPGYVKLSSDKKVIHVIKAMVEISAGPSPVHSPRGS